MTVWLLGLLLCLNGQDAAEPCLFVLKDGRTVAYLGELKVDDAAVTYTSPEGDLLQVDTDLVDLPKTRSFREAWHRKQARLARARNSRPPEDTKDPRSLPEQIGAYNQAQKEREKAPPEKTLVYTDDDARARRGETRGPTPGVTDIPTLGEGDLTPQALTRRGEQAARDVQAALADNAPARYLLYALTVILVLSNIVAMGLWLYLTVTAYGRALVWGMGLTAVTVGTIAALLYTPGPVQALSLVVANLAMVTYIGKCRYGKRALTLGVLYLPLLLSAVTAAVIVLTVMP